MSSDDLLQAAADRFGTPCYVYDLDIVSRQLESLRAALPGAQVHYAVRANPCAAVLAHLAASGAGAEVITLAELERSLAAGFAGRRIVFGGPGHDARVSERVREAGVGLISIDSGSQAELWLDGHGDAGFLLRLNPGLDPQTHEHLATGAATSKFGLAGGEVVRLAERLQAAGRLRGFHVHAGSQIDTVDVYDEILSRLEPLFRRFPGARTLDIGGGFAVPHFPLAEFSRRIRGFVAELELELIVEPGRYLVATCGCLVTRVLHVKDGPVRHVIADAGMADLLRPALYGARHPVRMLGAEGAATVVVDVDGPLCENADRLARQVRLPAVRQGDLLAVGDAGAYGFAMASNYASSLRPAEVVVRGGRLALARRRETVADIMRLESGSPDPAL